MADSNVVHCKRARYDVYIGRPSKWGNPFAIGRDGTRKQVIARYERWLLTQPELVASLHELEGKTLGCWCARRACHGDVLARLAAEQAARR
jgi:bacteriorhodopsin